MGDLDQKTICSYFEFTNKSCEEHRHEKCALEYAGIGIKALCICNCHIDKKKKHPSARESKLTDIGQQLELFDSKVDVENDKQRST